MDIKTLCILPVIQDKCPPLCNFLDPHPKPDYSHGMTTNVSHAIIADGLTRRFGGLTAVDAVSFTVEPGEVFGLLGPNGAGKTTLVRLLNGVLQASAGTARVLGADPSTHGDTIRARTGVLTEQPALYERLTARDNLRFFGTMYGVPDADLPRRVDELLATFDLSARADDRVGGFSKGMKQRLALARTLIHQPELLFFDEPTAGLDPEAARGVTALIEQLSGERGRTVFLCTHNLDEAQRLCSRVAVINKGRLLAVGAPAQLARDLWQGTWVDITLKVAPSDGLLINLGALAGVQNLKLDGTQLTVQVSDETAIPAVVARVVELGGQIMRVAPREHSLEEIYFTLQGGAA
jgi:ABC-2 type transport system ATP-binding protein